MHWYAKLTREMSTLGLDRRNRAEVPHYRRMESMRKTVDVRDNVLQLAKRGVNARPRHRCRHSDPQPRQIQREQGQLLANVIMQVSSEPRSLLLLGGNDARGQTLALVLYALLPTCALFMKFLHEVTYWVFCSAILSLEGGRHSALVRVAGGRAGSQLAAY